MKVTFHLPAGASPEITVVRPPIGRTRVLVDGIPADRIHTRTSSYRIPLPDGTSKELRLAGQWTGLKAIVDGQELQLERALSAADRILTFVPLGLLVFFGLIGASIGLAGAAINARIARSSARPAARAASMLGVSAACIVACFGASFALSTATAPSATIEVGTCLDPITDPTRTALVVPCSDVHEGEVFGITWYEAATYPGDIAIAKAADDFCTQAFADYIGQADPPNHRTVVIEPDAGEWAAGDHGIGCVDVRTPPATGSIREAAP